LTRIASILKSTAAFVWEVVVDVITKDEIIYYAIGLSICFVLRWIAHGNGLIDKYIWTIIAVAIAGMFWIRSILERPGVPSTVGAPRRPNRWYTLVITVSLLIAIGTFLQGYASPPLPDREAPFKPSPPSETQRMMSDPRFKEGLRIADEISRGVYPTTAATTSPTSRSH